jgi:hypothetical protein
MNTLNEVCCIWQVAVSELRGMMMKREGRLLHATSQLLVCTWTSAELSGCATCLCLREPAPSLQSLLSTPANDDTI